MVKWLISYILLVTIPLMIWLFLYFSIEDTMTESAVEYNAAVIDSSIRNIEDIVSQVNLSNIQLSMSNRMKELALLEGQLDAEDFYEFRLLSDEIKTAALSHSAIYDIYVYLPGIDWCIFSNGSMESEVFYNTFYSGEEGGYQQWKNEMTESPYFRQKVNTYYSTSRSSEECIAFIQPFPLTSKESNAVCVIMVRLSDVTAAFGSEDDTSNAATFAILDENGEFVLRSGEQQFDPAVLKNAENGKKQSIGGEQCYILKTALRSPTWTIFAIIPMQQVLNDIRSIRLLSGLLFLAYLVICSVMIVLLLRHNYFPVKNMLQYVTEKLNIPYDRKTNEYIAIEQAFRETLAQNQAAVAMLEKQNDVVKQNFLNSLLKGNLGRIKWEEALQEFQLEFVSERFVVILFRIEDAKVIFADDETLSDQERLRAGNFIITNITEELLNVDNYTLCTIINDMPVSIVNVADENEKAVFYQIEQAVCQAQKAVEEYFKFSFTAAVSDKHDTYIGISNAWEEAGQAMEYRILYDDGAVIFYKDLAASNTGIYYFPLESERMLINYIKTGKLDAAQKVVDDIYDTNFNNKNIMPLPFVKCLMFDLASTMIKTLNEISSNSKEKFESSTDTVVRLLHCENIFEMKRVMRQLLEEVCEVVNRIGGKRVDQQVIEFISQNYSNSQMTVASIAEYMELHPTYLSMMFKEETGYRLLDYIMGYRIGKAKSLLIQASRNSIEEIAHQVGYDNVRTFVRIFKKYEGVTPAQYRKANQPMLQNQNSEEESL